MNSLPRKELKSIYFKKIDQGSPEILQLKVNKFAMNHWMATVS